MQEGSSTLLTCKIPKPFANALTLCDDSEGAGFYLTGMQDGINFRILLSPPHDTPLDSYGWWITETQELRTVASEAYPSSAFYEIHTFTGPLESYIKWQKDKDAVKVAGSLS